MEVVVPWAALIRPFFIAGFRAEVSIGNTKLFLDMAAYASLSYQRAMEITIPRIEDQRESAHLLGTLDKQIELNRRTNKNDVPASGETQRARPRLAARLPLRSAMAVGGALCDTFWRTTTKPNTGHDPRP